MTETVTIEKQVWESTLNRSMVLQAENAQLKKWCEEFNALDVAKENTKLKERLKKTQELELEVKRENAQLKELLKECQGSIATLLSKRITEVNGIKQKELLAKINQALGEE